MSIKISFFDVFEAVLAPLVYIKTFYTILLSYRDIKLKVLNLLRWGLFGFFYMIFILGGDVVVLISILKMYDGCKANYNNIDNDDEEMTVDRKCELFNEVREVVI